MSEIKFCVLPGQTPARVAKTDGRCIVIGEELRTIPEDMQREAIAAGAYTEDQLNAMKAALTPAKPAAKAKEEEKTPPAETPERAGKILAATNEILTLGNPEDMTTTGLPRKEVLEALLGFAITGKERDEAFAEAKKV